MSNQNSNATFTITKENGKLLINGSHGAQTFKVTENQQITVDNLTGGLLDANFTGTLFGVKGIMPIPKDKHKSESAKKSGSVKCKSKTDNGCDDKDDKGDEAVSGTIIVT